MVALSTYCINLCIEELYLSELRIWIRVLGSDPNPCKKTDPFPMLKCLDLVPIVKMPGSWSDGWINSDSGPVFLKGSDPDPVKVSQICSHMHHWILRQNNGLLNLLRLDRNPVFSSILDPDPGFSRVLDPDRVDLNPDPQLCSICWRYIYI